MGNVLVALLIFTAFFLFFLAVSRKGRVLYLRKIPGVAAIEEAIGGAIHSAEVKNELAKIGAVPAFAGSQDFRKYVLDLANELKGMK